MAPFARRAGGASALLGMLQYAIGAVSGALVGMLHNGSVVPMAAVVAAAGVCVALVCCAAPAARREGRSPGSGEIGFRGAEGGIGICTKNKLISR